MQKRNKLEVQNSTEENYRTKWCSEDFAESELSTQLTEFYASEDSEHKLSTNWNQSWTGPRNYNKLMTTRKAQVLVQTEQPIRQEKYSEYVGLCWNGKAAYKKIAQNPKPQNVLVKIRKGWYLISYHMVYIIMKRRDKRAKILYKLKRFLNPVKNPKRYCKFKYQNSKNHSWIHQNMQEKPSS